MVDDLALHDNLDLETLLATLNERYRDDQIFTYCGDVLLVANPFKALNIFDKDTSKKYENKGRHDALPPHIFATADKAYRSLLRSNIAQTFIISGESGSGKTETTKLLLGHLTNITANAVTNINQKIMQLNPLLEAFGNAKTIMNGNSSRFGKFIELQFNEDGDILGAQITVYLLEKSRITVQINEDMNFHVFYAMLAGLSAPQLQRLRLPDAHVNSFRFLNNAAPLNLARGRLHFVELETCLDLIGFLSNEREGIYRVLAAILNLGNVDFVPSKDGKLDISSASAAALVSVADLLMIESDLLIATLTSVTSTIGRGEQIIRSLNVQQAEDCRDAIAKLMYERLFHWVVYRINKLLAGNELAQAGSVNILDIFGFENFSKNSFEQLCINLTNEYLQSLFVMHIFTWEQEDYVSDGISWSAITFKDNQPCLDLFVARPLGLLSILDEESHFPNASDHTLLQKLHQECLKHPNFEKGGHRFPDSFAIVHYAGSVIYDVQGFLSKNRDTVPESVTFALETSEDEFVRTVIAVEPSSQRIIRLSRQMTLSKMRLSRPARNSAAAECGINKERKKTLKRMLQGNRESHSSKRVAPTVLSSYRRSLARLIDTVSSSELHFIRCLKPNAMAQPLHVDFVYLETQLQYCGVLDTVKIRRHGFPIRPFFKVFINNYGVLAFDLRDDILPSRENCELILNCYEKSMFQLGTSRVFMKLDLHESLLNRIDQLENAALIFQKTYRGRIGRKVAKQIKRAEERRIETLRHEKEREHQKLVAAAAAAAAAAEQEAAAKDIAAKAASNKIVPASPQSVPSSRLLQPIVGSRSNHNRTISIDICNQLAKEPWFFGKLSRNEVDVFLVYTGDFLIRERPKHDGIFVVSCQEDECVKHYIISYTDATDFQYKSQYFADLPSFVTYLLECGKCLKRAICCPGKDISSVTFVDGIPLISSECPEDVKRSSFKSCDSDCSDSSVMSSFAPYICSDIVVSMRNEPFFHKDVSRDETDTILPCAGDYLLRESSRNPEQIVLSVRVKSNQVMHFLILTEPDNSKIILNETKVDFFGDYIALLRTTESIIINNPIDSDPRIYDLKLAIEENSKALQSIRSKEKGLKRGEKKSQKLEIEILEARLVELRMKLDLVHREENLIRKINILHKSDEKSQRKNMKYIDERKRYIETMRQKLTKQSSKVEKMKKQNVDNKGQIFFGSQFSVESPTTQALSTDSPVVVVSECRSPLKADSPATLSAVPLTGDSACSPSPASPSPSYDEKSPVVPAIVSKKNWGKNNKLEGRGLDNFKNNRLSGSHMK